MIPGPTQASPMNERAERWRFRERHLFAQDRLLDQIAPAAAVFFRPRETHPALRADLFEPAWEKVAAALLGGGRFSRRNARTSSRNACSSRRVFEIHHKPPNAATRSRCHVRVAIHRPRPLRALEVELHVVFGGEADRAVQADAVDPDARECIGSRSPWRARSRGRVRPARRRRTRRRSRAAT